MTKYHNALHIACGRAPQTPLSAKILKCGGGAADVVGGRLDLGFFKTGKRGLWHPLVRFKWFQGYCSMNYHK